MAFPEWTKKHKQKGIYIGKNRDGYFLYSAKSVYDPITKKGKKVFTEYLGVINEKDGFIPKSKKFDNYIGIEYGLSNLIYKNFKTILKKHIYSTEKYFSDNLIIIAVVCFVYDSYDCLNLSYLSVVNNLSTMPDYITDRRKKSIENLKLIIKEEIGFGLDDMSFDYFCARLKNVLAFEKNGIYEFMDIPEDVRNVINKQGWKI